jgi:hypothetical protein
MMLALASRLLFFPTRLPPISAFGRIVLTIYRQIIPFFAMTNVVMAYPAWEHRPIRLMTM